MKRKVLKSTKARGNSPLAISAPERRRMEAELREAEERIALSALDALSAHIAILDTTGTILAVNQAWREFAREKAACLDRGAVGKNYFLPSEMPASGSACRRFTEGVQQVLSGQREEFSIEYACQVRGAERWFHGKVTRFNGSGASHVVIAHEDISQRVRLEREIVDVSAREQQRFGQELHDGLSQQLTGLKFKASLLEYQLQSKDLPEANDAKAISKLLNEATDEASNLARTVRPVEIESRGLMMALGELAARTAHAHRVKCVCVFRRAVFVHDNNVATHVYRIAEEAITNALQHGEATDIRLALDETKDCVTLTVRDNGRGLPKDFPEDGGLGLHMMRYRARMIGGSVEVRRDPARGTIVSCAFQKRGIAAPVKEPARAKNAAR
jgi:signal transduction histidine kinase